MVIKYYKTRWNEFEFLILLSFEANLNEFLKEITKSIILKKN